MRVVLSRFAGACYGVQRALDLAESAILGGEPAVTLGPIIHNPKVVKHLSEQGIRPVSSLDEAHGDIVIIRSHGVSPEVMDQIKQRGLEMIDATCPHVARAQKAAEELALQGCTVVVVGEAGHPEVESLTAYARKGGARTFVVKDPALWCKRRRRVRHWMPSCPLLLKKDSILRSATPFVLRHDSGKMLRRRFPPR